MPIKVDWIDRNITVDSFRLYRSTTPIPDSPLPEPLATIPAGTFTYTDLTTVRNKTYYYRVGTVVGAEETLSSNAALAHMPYTGPGPQKLLRGDWASGYFGQVSMTDLFTPAEIMSLANTAMGAVTNNITWHKFVYQGKILFYPHMCLSAGFSYQHLYSKGLLYGLTPSSEWPPYIKTTFGTIPQGVTINRGNDYFVVRTPQQRQSLLSVETTGFAFYNGEYDNCLALAWQGRSLPATIPQLPQGALDDQVHETTYYSMCADLQANGVTALVKTNPVDTVSTIGVTSTHPTFGWRPVLELIF